MKLDELYIVYYIYIYKQMNCIDELHEFDEFEKMVSHGRTKQGDLADDRFEPTHFGKPKDIVFEDIVM